MSFISFETTNNDVKCVKFRGAFPTYEQAVDHAKKINETYDQNFHVFVGEGFKWLPIGKQIDTKIDLKPDSVQNNDQKWICLSFLSQKEISECSPGFIKFHGAFPTYNKAIDHAKTIDENGDALVVSVGHGYRWMYCEFENIRLYQMLGEFRQKTL